MFNYQLTLASPLLNYRPTLFPSLSLSISLSAFSLCLISQRSESLSLSRCGFRLSLSLSGAMPCSTYSQPPPTSSSQRPATTPATTLGNHPISARQCHSGFSLSVSPPLSLSHSVSVFPSLSLTPCVRQRGAGTSTLGRKQSSGMCFWFVYM